MRKQGFLARLAGKGKICLVEPSREIERAYFSKSESNLVSAKILLRNGRLEESVALAYYSMYHSLTAVLFRIGVKSENHSASIVLLKKMLGKDDAAITHAKKERDDKQYYVDFKITDAEAKDAITEAEKFNCEMADFSSRISNENVNEYRRIFRKLTKTEDG